MASSNKTPHYNLSQFAPTDKPAWQGDYNADMKKIDNGIYAAQNKADSLDASISEATNKATQALEKAEAAEDAAENAAALAQEAKTTADNISGDLSGKVNKAGDTMTGPLVLPGDPTQPMEAATKQYADKMLPLAGGTMTGALTLPADPTSEMQAATKKYVDTAISGIPTGGAGESVTAYPGVSVNLNPNRFLKFGNMIFINLVATIPQENAAASIFSVPYQNLSGKTLTSSITATPTTSSGTPASTLTAVVSGSLISVNNNEALTAGTYAINGWILIKEG